LQAGLIMPFGLSLVLLAGILLGSFTLPMKFARRWPWEAIWLVYSISGLLMLPMVVAFATLPSLSEIYLRSGARSLALVAGLGFGWGIGSVLFGIGVSMVGMSLGFSVILGVTAAVGSLVPMLVLAPHEILALKGGIILAGQALVLLGIYVCGIASHAKAKEGVGEGAAVQPSHSLRIGLIICISSGILSAMLNLAMAFGQEIATRAIELGGTKSNASNAIWALAVAFGALANAGYCITLLLRNRSASAFRAPNTANHWLLGALMGGLWYGGITLYGHGASALGTWGTVLGWPILMAMMIVTANVLGWLTGEWRDASSKAQRTMIGGVLVLGAGVIAIGYSGTV
jgi:L-rhamnose-H+ transport protein